MDTMIPQQTPLGAAPRPRSRFRRVQQPGAPAALPGAPAALPDSPSLGGVTPLAPETGTFTPSGIPSAKGGAQVGNETGHGVPPTGGLPGGGKTPGQVSGITPVLPPPPGGVQPPKPTAPQVLPPAPPPVPPVMPPSAITEPPNPVGAIDQGAPEFNANLRSDVYAPGEDAALANAQKGTQTALNNITGAPSYSTAAAGGESRYRKLFGDVKEGDRASKYAGAQDDALDALGGPSRTELAQKTLADFEKQGEAGLANRFRKVGQSAAKFGRIGMGDVNAELGSIQGDYERDLMAKRNELASSVAEGDIGDRFRRVDATSGLRRGEAGIDAGLRDETFARDKSAIDYGGRDADRDIQDRYDQFGAAGTLEDRLYGQGRSNRDEMRTERGRQDEVEQRSLDNRIRERSLGNAEREQRLSRALALMQAGGKVPSLDELLAGG